MDRSVSFQPAAFSADFSRPRLFTVPYELMESRGFAVGIGDLDMPSPRHRSRFFSTRKQTLSGTESVATFVTTPANLTVLVMRSYDLCCVALLILLWDLSEGIDFKTIRKVAIDLQTCVVLHQRAGTCRVTVAWLGIKIGRLDIIVK